MTERGKRSILTGAFLVAVLIVSAIVWIFAALQSLDELERRGQADLALASDRLVSSLFSYRQLAVALAADPRLRDESLSEADLADVLRRTSDLSGALNFVLLDSDGALTIGATEVSDQSWKERSFVRTALNGSLGREVGTSPLFGRRVFSYAAPVYSTEGPVQRVLVAIIDLEAIEADFRGSRPAIFISDDTGVIYFSNRSELVLRNRYDDDFIDFQARMIAGHDIWDVSAGRYVPEKALHLTQNLPVIGMQAEALIDIAPALSDAWMQATVTGALCLLFGGIIYSISNQRRILARANTALEDRVSKRTKELKAANTSLRAEVAERRDAEEALKRAQQDLIQAGKLSALGKMSAGISHELNQPLMAIQSFAENAAIFLSRGDDDAARKNLENVSELAGRMGRIIRNFRAFARQERDTVHRVDLVAVIHSAIDIAHTRLDEHEIDLRLDLPAVAWVQGGEVRLQQVMLNLMSNAVDAMAGRAERALEIAVKVGPRVVLTVQDTGPGIDEPEKVFEPFYSTKEIGEAEGVGLGMSISYGLVQSFGGAIRGQNAPDGGAVFTVELQPWAEEGAAA